MKILFVCRGNVARSQMAETIYNKLTNSHDAESAGTHADDAGETLGQYSKRVGGSYTVKVMNDNGYAVDHKQRTQLTEEMLTKYDVVVSMSGKKYTPKWLADSPKYVFLKIIDPAGRSYAITQKTLELVEVKVKELINKYNLRSKELGSA